MIEKYEEVLNSHWFNIKDRDRINWKIGYKDLDKRNLQINLEEFEIGEKRLFIKIISNEVYDKNSEIKLELENKLDINNYEIIHNHKNCFFLN